MIALASASADWAAAAVYIAIIAAFVIWHWINRRYR